MNNKKKSMGKTDKGVISGYRVSTPLRVTRPSEAYYYNCRKKGSDGPVSGGATIGWFALTGSR